MKCQFHHILHCQPTKFMDCFEVSLLQFDGIPDYLDYLAVRHLVKYTIAYVIGVEYLLRGRNLGRLLFLLCGFMVRRRLLLGCLLIRGVWLKYRRMSGWLIVCLASLDVGPIQNYAPRPHRIFLHSGSHVEFLFGIFCHPRRIFFFVHTSSLLYDLWKAH